ncbi:MAG TPA: DNA polymerase I [Acidimicrobiales bacterium]|nr:DNA polymerase I [Acidimicrobiales bacterium]
MLIDGNSLTYRAFFALPTDLATSSGQVTNAVYGFTSMLVNLLRDHEPERIAVAFDTGTPTFRHEALESYKAQRDETPELLIPQFALVTQVLDVLGICRIALDGFEADDVIATLATRAAADGEHVIVVTGDRDAYQLVTDPFIRVLYNKRGVSDYVLYDEAGILERTGVTPTRYVDYAALRGDPSDNLPGVPGVGEKTAAKLINAYGDAVGVLEHAAEQTPKLAENLVANAVRVRSNVELMRLVRDAPVDCAPEDLTFDRVADAGAVRRLFDFLEFRGMFERFAQVVDLGDETAAEDAAAPVARETDIAIPVDTAELATALDRFEPAESRVIAGAWSPEGELLAVIVAAATEVDPVPVVVARAALVAEPEGGAALRRVLADGPVIGHGVQELLRWLIGMGIDDVDLRFDTMLAAYLLDPARAAYTVGEVVSHSLGRTLPEHSAQGQFDLEDPSARIDSFDEEAAQVVAVGELVESLRERLASQGMLALLTEIEVPLVGVLARMEHVGVGVDVAALEALGADLTRRANDLTASIQDHAGRPFNVNSTKQLREVLFDELGLTPQKKTKTGYSTDAATLEKLRDSHPIVAALLTYREVEKLRSTYAEGLLAEVAPDGRIHATFNQTVARTGRLSSDRPNLHNIPVRTDEGRAFRRVFVPRPGTDLLVADYNQVELRCIAHLSGDPGLIEAFARGDDIHTATAARVFGVPSDSVTHAQRARAKMVSYGLAYGMEAYGLAQRLGVEVVEARGILEAYFEAFPSVHSYMEATVAEARDRGYTLTLFGRRRPIPELASPNARLRAAGERQAMNAGIQGLAADIFKIALVRLDERLRSGKLDSTLILQVHDEVLLEVPPDERVVVESLTHEVMVGAADLSVPLEVNLAFGHNWADAKS